MELYIHSDRFFSRDEDNNASKLMVLATNQVIDVDGFYHILLEMPDRWIDMTSMSRIIALTSLGNRDVMNGLWNLALRLHACGIADIRDVPSFGLSGARFANLRDYYAISEFGAKNLNRGHSCSVTINPLYYSFSQVFTRIEDRSEFYILWEEDGTIRAMAAFGQSKRFFGGVVLQLRSVIFDSDMDEDQCRDALIKMIDCFCSALKGKTHKLRYEFTNPRQEFIVSTLKEAGFCESAFFKEELTEGSDLVLLDRSV